MKDVGACLNHGRRRHHERTPRHHAARTSAITANANMLVKIPVASVYDIMLRTPFRTLHFIMNNINLYTRE